MAENNNAVALATIEGTGLAFLGGVLNKRLPHAYDFDLESMTQQQAYDACALIMYMLMYANDFMMFSRALEYLGNVYPELYAHAEIGGHGYKDKLEQAINKLYNMEWLSVKQNRERLANKIFFEDFEVTEYLLSKALQMVEDGEKDGIINAQRVLELRAKLVGTFAPEKVEIGVERKVELTDAKREALRLAAQEAMDEARLLEEQALELDREREEMFAQLDEGELMEGVIIEGEFTDAP